MTLASSASFDVWETREQGEKFIIEPMVIAAAQSAENDFAPPAAKRGMSRTT